VRYRKGVCRRGVFRARTILVKENMAVLAPQAELIAIFSGYMHLTRNLIFLKEQEEKNLKRQWKEK